MQTCDFNSPGGRLGALKYAVSLFESGEFAQAEQLARKIRDAAPTDEHILRFLGQTVYKQGRVEEAATLIEGALKLNPMRAAYHNDLGAMFAEMNRWPDAEAAYRMAKVLDPGSIDAAFNLTLALARQEKTDAAWRELDALEKASPEFSEMPRLRGEILIAEKRYDKAVDVFSKAIERGLDTPDMHLGLGSALFHAGKRDEAFEVFFTSGKIDPENALANCHAGELMLEKGELKKARRLFEKAIEIDPMIGAAYNCLGILLEKEGDFSGAAAKFLRAIEVDPQNAPAYINLGNCHSRKNKRDAARACFQRALEIDPGLSSAWNNLALIFYSEHRFDEADEAFQKALLAAPDLPQTKFNQGLMRLSLGDFESGWVEYEERHALRAAENKGIHPQHAKLTCPKWSGEALGEKHLLIVPEQGFGDHIQFVRYFSVLRTRYPDARLSYMCNFLMFRLFSGIAAKYGVLLLLNFDTHDEAWDFFVPLLSLPMYAGGTKMSIPTDTPYLELPEAFVSKWGARLPTSDGKRVGIVWSGSEHYRAAGWRNMTLAQLAPLFEIPGISWISLQRLPKGDAGEHIRDEGFSEKIFDPMPDVKDFADTAAIIANLDLVISVDTAVLHLAGAMGKPAWLLNRFHTDWRWQYTSSDSLWYPTLRIFRQKKFGAWSPVVKKAASALKKWLAANANEALWKLLDPPRPDAAFNLALAFSRGRKADEALHVLDILEKKHPEFAWQFALRGKILRSEGRGAEAVEALSRAVTLGIEAPAIVAQLGMALADAGMKDEAFKVLAESGKADSDDAMVNHYLGNLLRDLGKTAEARRFFEKAIEANPRLTESLDALECLLREEGDTAAADAAFARKEDIRGRIDRYRAAMKDCEAALFGIHS